MSTATPTDAPRTTKSAPGRTVEVETAPPPKPAARPAVEPMAVPASHGRTRWWVWLLMVVVVVGLGALLFWRIRAAKANAAAGADAHKGGGRGLPVVVATARRGNLPVYLYGLGTVTPLKTVNLLTRVDGAITEIHYDEGQPVKVGDFLIQIDPRPYQAALDQAKGQLKKDQATKAYATWSVTQDKYALRDNSIAQQQLQTDQASLDTAIGSIEVDNANIEAAQVNLDYCHITSPIDGKIGLRLVDLGNIVHAAGTTNLAVITQENPITVVFTFAEDDLEQLQKRIHTGVPVSVDAYDRTLTKRLARGTLIAVDNEIDPTTLTFKIKAQFNNPDGTLFPSQAVNARLLVDTVQNAVLVPSAAIQHSPTVPSFVYVVQATAKPAGAAGDAGTGTGNGDAAAAPKGHAGATTRGSGGAGGRGDETEGTVKIRPVTTGAALSAVGPTETDTTVITSGLEPGDVVVTTGVDKLIDGTKVVARQAPAPTTGPTTTPAGGTAPTDETGVGGPAMGKPSAGGPSTRPAGAHPRHQPTAN
jgi:multidrug efflux system membrane fusion protein